MKPAKTLAISSAASLIFHSSFIYRVENYLVVCCPVICSPGIWAKPGVPEVLKEHLVKQEYIYLKW